MVLASQDSIPVASRHHLVHFVLYVVSAFFHKFRRVGDVYDVTEFVLVDTTVVVEVSLMSESLKSVHVEVQVEITRHNR
jgi:hypothetical protein